MKKSHGSLSFVRFSYFGRKRFVVSKTARIDSHLHFWNYSPERYSWINESMQVIQKDFMPNDLEPLLQDHGFDAAIAVEAHHSEEETEFLLNLAAKNRIVKGVVGWIDLASKDIESRLEAFSTDPALKGLRHTVWDQKGEFLLQPAFQYGISKLDKLSLTYDLLVFEDQLDSAVDLVKKFQNQKFVLDHLGNPKMDGAPSACWIKNIEKLAELPNVYCKLSGLAEKFELALKNEGLHLYLDKVVDAFGINRIMFGSNWPVCNVSADYSSVFLMVDNYFKSFSEDEKAAVFGINAADFYRIEL